MIGRSGGRPFAIPFAYTFSGKRVAAAVSLEVQRSEYIQRHQLQRGSLPELRGLDKSEIAVECGEDICDSVQTNMLTPRGVLLDVQQV